jgi:hypothetical protein
MEKKMKNILYIFFLAGLCLALFSCANNSSTSSTASTTTELEGTWVTSCYASGSSYYIQTVIVSGTDVTMKVKVHTDSSCSTDNGTWIDTYSSLSIGDNVTFVSGSTGHYFSVAVSTFTYTPTLASDVSTLNAASWCGYSNWTLNTAKDYTGKTCGSTSYSVANTTYLGLYMLVGNNLFTGTYSSDGNYPTSVYTSIPIVKQ